MIELDPFRWVSIAEAEIGQKERPGKPNNDRISFYHSFTEIGRHPDEVPWCSSALCYVFESAGIRSTRDALASSWRTWGRGCAPRYGAVLVWDHHVNLYIYQDRRKELIWCLGGNQRNGFNVLPFKKEKLLAARFPDADLLLNK